MSSAHRHKISNKYKGDLDLVFGDDIDIYGEDTSKAGQASTWLNAISTVSKGAGEIAQQKADADKAAAQAKAVKDAQDELMKAQTALLMAQQEAMFEKEPDGPKHKDLAKAMTALQVAQAKVTAAQTGSPMSLMATGTPSSTASSNHPWYFWPAIIGGVVVGGAILYRVVSHSNSPSRYVKGA